MKIDLGRADLGALRVDLPGSTGQAIEVRSARGLRGIVEQAATGLSVSDVNAELVILDALRLALGAVTLGAGNGTQLTDLALTLDSGERLTLAATMTELACDLSVDVGVVAIRGKARLHAPALAVEGEEGSLRSAEIEISDFSLTIGDLALGADVLRGQDVEMVWGGAGFRLRAASLGAGTLRAATGDVALSAHGCSATSFLLDGPSIAAGRFAVGSGHVSIGLRPAPPAGESRAPTRAPAVPLLDPALLDRVSGQLDVDVAVDLTVPVIGRRKATHRLRVALDQGTLDYRALEHNLAPLEDALLDFSVRDYGLVLERVNPLFPARGRGKPVVRWDMRGDDLALAQHGRVRLAVLPRAALATEASSTPPAVDERAARKGGIALRELALLRIAARLRLEDASSPIDGRIQIHHVEQLVLEGNVFHEPGGSREGALLGELSGLALSVDALPIGEAGTLTIARITAAGLAPIEAAFADVTLRKLDIGSSALVCEGVAVRF
ncbi:MAG: hypothetical protein JWP97_4444 [Labilithrix sp.]|nr:hypothetical protein [Labilithrix sp.]